MRSYWGVDHGTEISKYEVSKGLKEWKQGYQNKKRAYHLKRANKWTKRWHDLDADTSMPYKKFQRKQMKAYDNLDYHYEKLRTMGFDEYGRKMVSKYYSEVRPASRGELEAKRKSRPIHGRLFRSRYKQGYAFADDNGNYVVQPGTTAQRSGLGPGTKVVTRFSNRVYTPKGVSKSK